MSEWVVDARGGACNQCGSEYQRLAQHWSRNQHCSYPDVSAAQHEAIRGCLVGDGSLDNPNDGPPALRIASMRRPHIVWVRDQLGWLVRGVTRDTDGAYRLRTLSHPTLGRYWTWTDGPPADWTLTKPVARLWYACDGGLEWPGSSTQPRVTWTITNNAKRRACKQALAKQGYEAMVWDRRLALPFEATERFLAWLGDPTPGSEHKWAKEREEYERRRGELS